MVDIYVNDKGTTKKVVKLYVNNDGNVVEVKEGYVNDKGNVKQFYASAGPPSPPGNFRATAQTSSSITLAWDASVENGFPVTFYELQRSTNNVDWTNTITVASGTFSYQYTGLAADTPYFFRIKAKSSVGDSAYSTTSAQTVAGPPLTPTASILAASTTASSVSIRVTPNSAGPAQTQFLVDIYDRSNGREVGVRTDQFPNTTFPGQSTLVVSSLTSNTAYSFYVRAQNAAGSSQAYEAGVMCTSRSGLGTTGSVTTAEDPCDTGTFKDVGYGKNIASEGGCGIEYGTTNIAAINGKTVEQINRPGSAKFAIALLGGNTNQFFLRKVTTYPGSSTGSPSARTFLPGNAVFTSGLGTTGQICKWDWTLPDAMPWEIGQSYTVVIEY